jgi:hypothetical protein
MERIIMKKQAIISLLAGCLMVVGAQAVRAAEYPPQQGPGPQTPQAPQAQSQGQTQMSTVIHNLNLKGYTVVHKIKYRDGFYYAKAVNAQGKETKVRYNPQTSEIYVIPTNPPISILQATQKAEREGFQVFRIKLDGDRYKIRAFDKNGERVSIRVDATTGALTVKEHRFGEEHHMGPGAREREHNMEYRDRERERMGEPQQSQQEDMMRP